MLLLTDNFFAFSFKNLNSILFSHLFPSAFFSYKYNFADVYPHKIDIHILITNTEW